MRILHYSLGLPPARSGGLTRYATDLMTAQCGRHQVSLLYPGRWQPFGGRVRVRRGKDYGDVAVYELINPLPVPLSYGVREPGGFLQAKKLDRASLEAFYEQVRPDILHLHTWMGLPAYLDGTACRCAGFPEREGGKGALYHPRLLWNLSSFQPGRCGRRSL